MAITYSAASSNTKVRPYGLDYYSLASFEFKPGIWAEWYQKYGKGFGLMDFLKMAGSVVNVNRDTVTAFEDGSIVRPIRVNSSGISTSTTAGDDIAFTLHADEYDTNNDTYLRIGDSIIIPPAYLSEDVPAEYRVSSVGATSSAACAATPLRSTAQITTAVPANAYLNVGPTSYGRGMGQPSARSTYGYQRSFYTRILKESVDMVGGLQAQQSYRQELKNGGEGLWMRAQVEAEFNLDNQVDQAIFLSDYNNNSVTGTDAYSGSAAIKTTKGLWNHLEDLAQELNYVTRFSMTDFETAKELFRSQGVVTTEIGFVVGPHLVTQLDNMGLDYIKEYSGGTDLTKTMGELGIDFNVFKKNGLKFICKELASFSNPNTYGVDNLGTYLGNAGVMIPMTDVTISDPSRFFDGSEGGKVSIPNLSLGYLNNNGEDRTRIFQVVAGVNGLGLEAKTQYDKVDAYFLTEFMLVAMQVNQMIRVLKQGTY